MAPDRRKQLLGASFVVLVALIWVTFSFVVKEVWACCCAGLCCSRIPGKLGLRSAVHPQVEGEGLHPFLLSYIANSLFVVYLPVHWAVQRGKQAAQQHSRYIAWQARPFQRLRHAQQLAQQTHPYISGCTLALELDFPRASWIHTKPRPQVTQDEELPISSPDSGFCAVSSTGTAGAGRLELKPVPAHSTFAAASVVSLQSAGVLGQHACKLVWTHRRLLTTCQETRCLSCTYPGCRPPDQPAALMHMLHCGKPTG